MTQAKRRTIACGPVAGLFQTHEAGPFDRVDLLSDHSEPSHVAPDLVEHIRGDRHILWRAQSLEPLRRLAQLRFEAADAEPGQRRLQPVDQAGPFADQVLALAAWPLVVFLLERRNRRHPTMLGLAAQPAQEGTHQQRGVEPDGVDDPRHRCATVRVAQRPEGAVRDDDYHDWA
jgi:hypothetical protein